MTGVVRTLMQDKGYGFIRGTDGVDRFFLWSSMMPPVKFADLQPGLTVEFEHEEGPKGARASAVRVVR